MRALITLIAGLGITAGLATETQAQGAPSHNRRMEAIAAMPSDTGGPGMFDITAVYSVGLGQQTSAPLDLSTEAVFHVNGMEVGVIQTGVLAGGGAGDCGACSGGCGTGYIDGVLNTLLCLEDQGIATNGCSCQFPSIQAPLTVPLFSGDEIMVLLRPAPGALPDPDTSDDLLRETIHDGPIFWDRRIQSLSIEPTPGAPSGTFDLTVEWDMVTAGTGLAKNLDPQFEVQINGVSAGVFDPPCGPWFAAPFGDCNGCDGSTCGMILCDGNPVFEMICGPTDEGCACISAQNSSIVIPGLTFVPEIDELVVLLKPVPGALPELPGFEEDEECLYEPWVDLGFALAGHHGAPVLLGDGTLKAGDPVTLVLGNALENTTAHLVIGLSAINAPFKGGVLVPDPTAPGNFFSFPTGAAGTLNLAAIWPVGFPANFSTYYQCWIEDAAGIVGFASSNALSATTPP